jgi:putative membrane protein
VKAAWAHVARDSSSSTAASAAASEVSRGSVADPWTTWQLDPWIVIPLLAFAALYARGVWRDGRVRAGVAPWRVVAFATGWLFLALALVSPIHALGEALFSVHMTQHEILMLVAAPLLVWGSPMAPVLRAMPRGAARGLGRIVHRSGAFGLARALREPLTAWLLHAAVLWAWHVPALFQAALESEAAHAAQHVSFLASALVFWWALLQGKGRALDYGAAVLYLFTTALHSGLLGALLTFSTSVWYPGYAGSRAWTGLTPLEDQQLGGLIMWVPACSLYLVIALLLFARWMQATGRRVRRMEAGS